MFSNTINVLTGQQDRPQRKTQKFIGSIQQKIRFIFLLCKSITPSAMTFVNTGGRWNGGRTASSSTQFTNLFPSNPHTNFRKLHLRANSRHKPCPPQLDTVLQGSVSPHSHSAHLCPLSITSSCNSYERAMPTRSSSHTALP